MNRNEDYEDVSSAATRQSPSKSEIIVFCHRKKETAENVKKMGQNGR